MKIPITLDALAEMRSWEDEPVWPLPLSATRRVLAGMGQGLHQAAEGLDQISRDILVLAANRFFGPLVACADIAALWQAASARGLELSGGNQLVGYLGGIVADDGWQPTRFGVAGDAGGSWGRRIARTAALNRMRHFPRAFTFPRHVAVSHNHLLSDVARRGNSAISFHHAQDLVDAAPPVSADCREAAEVAAAASIRAICSAADLAEPFSSRFATVTGKIVRAYATRAAGDLARLRASAGRLPESLWCGTTGSYPVRALALTVRGKSGRVTSFDHGGPAGALQWSTPPFGDRWLASHFISATSGTARLARSGENCGAIVLGHDGDPTFAMATRIPQRIAGKRPRVMYLIGPFLGFRQVCPPMLNDVVYHQFCMMLAKALAAMPIDLVARPRPNFKAGHPVQKLAKCDFRPYHQALADVDTVVFDDIHSTAFWEALCTDRRIVLVNLDYNRFVPEVASLIERRVQIVPTTLGEDNIPRFDRNALADAIQASETSVDPAPLRELLASSSQGSEALARTSSGRWSR